MLTHGGSLRAHYLFKTLADRTAALSIYRPDIAALPAMARRPWDLLPGAQVAAAELLPSSALPFIRRIMRLRVLDLHDIPVIHAAALGVQLSSFEVRRQRELTQRNLDAFERIAVVSEGLADLADIPPAKRIVVGNGTDTSVIKPGPWPERPAVGLVSGAAPGRGIELLVDAMRLVRHDLPGASLNLCLGGGEPASEAFIANLRNATREEAWVRIETVPYLRVGAFMERCTVLAVPHPPGFAWDVAPPVKLFDAMAAGRPVVSTPRPSTAAIIREMEAGIVAPSDSIEDFADSLLTVLKDPEGAERLGARARQAAVERFDWRILSEFLAWQVLGIGRPIVQDSA